MKYISERKSLIYYIILIIFSFILCIDRFNFTIDDTFISLRYVMNILNGFGPVFNPGERMEAISNPTWVWLLTGISYLFNINDQASLFYISSISGIILFLISGVLLFKLLKLILEDEKYAFFITLIFSLNPYIAFYSTNGMENSLIYFLLIIILYLTQKYLISKSTVLILLTGLFIGVLSISRPEGFIFIISYFGSIGLIKFSKDYNLNSKAVFISLLISTLIFISFELWRWSYYGELLPIPVYAKNYFSIATLKDGFKYFMGFFVYGICPFIPYLFLSGKLSFKELEINKKIMLTIITLFFGIQTVVVIYAGGDWMPASRLLLFNIPCFIVFLSIATKEAFSVIKNKNVLYTILSLTIFMNIYIGRDALRPVQSGFNFKKNQILFNELKNTTFNLKEITSQGNTVLANDIGAIAYFNPQLKFIDLYGLADKYIAKKVKGRHFYRSAPDYFLSLNCDYFMIVCGAKEMQNYKLGDTLKEVGYPPIDDLMRHKDFSNKYKPFYLLKGGIVFKNINTNN
jgi:arabinofuranosyltransferase